MVLYFGVQVVIRMNFRSVDSMAKAIVFFLVHEYVQERLLALFDLHSELDHWMCAVEMIKEFI